MAQFGTSYEPSVAAVTGFAAAQILQYINKNRIDQIETMKTLQAAQGDAAKGLGQAMYDTVHEQAESDREQAIGMISQGSVGVGFSAASLGTVAYRSGILGKYGDLAKFDSQENSLTAAEKSLEEGKSNVLLKGGNQNLQANANRLSDEQMDQLRRTDWSSEDSANQRGNLSLLKNMRGGGAEEEANPREDTLRARRLYDDVRKKIDDSKNNLSSARSNYEQKTTTYEQRLNNLGSSIGSTVNGQQNLIASKNREAQAKSQELQQYAQFNSDSQGQGVQASSKVYEFLNQTESTLVGSYYSELARANQAV